MIPILVILQLILFSLEDWVFMTCHLIEKQTSDQYTYFYLISSISFYQRNAKITGSNQIIQIPTSKLIKGSPTLVLGYIISGIKNIGLFRT